MDLLHSMQFEQSSVVVYVTLEYELFIVVRGSTAV